MARREKRTKGCQWSEKNLTYSSGQIQLWQLEQIAALTLFKLSYLKKENKHHPVPLVLIDTARFLLKIDFQTEDSYYSFIIKNIKGFFHLMEEVRQDEVEKCGQNQGARALTDDEVKNKIDSLIKELFGRNFCRVPQFLHELFNKILAGELTPAEVLLKLEWIFDERRYYVGQNKENLVDFLSSVSVLEKRHKFTVEETKKIHAIRNSADDFQNASLLELFALSIDDITKVLSEYFFHPYWGREEFKEHFLLLMFLKPPDRLQKTNMSMYLEYFRHNGINNVLKNMDPQEKYLLNDFLNRFSRVNWEEPRESHPDPHQ